MKRFLAVFILVCVFLPGCDSSKAISDRGLEIRKKLNSGKGCSFVAYITADMGDTTCAFTLNCTVDAEQNMVFSVVEPESIQGIGGSISSTGGKLSYDETVLAFSLLAQGEISPVSAPWLIWKGMLGGYLRAAGEDDIGFRMTFDDTFSGENVQIDVWMDDNDCPVCGEILWQGRRILTVRFENFMLL